MWKEANIAPSIIYGMAEEQDLVGVSTMMLFSSLDLFSTGSELEFSRAAPEMTASKDDAAACDSDREECRFVAMMPWSRCLLFVDNPANIMVIWTGMYLLSVFMVGYSLTSCRADLTQIQHFSISQDPRHKIKLKRRAYECTCRN